MKIVSDLKKKLKEVDYYRSQFDVADGTKNILFIDPVMSEFDFYSMIVPYLALEDTEKFRTAMTGMYRFNEIDSKKVTKLTVPEIQWASVIVLPMSLEPYALSNELFDQLREINPEAKIISTCEFDFYEIGYDHPLLEEKKLSDLIKKHSLSKSVADLRKEFKDKIVERLESNLRGSDRVIVMNDRLQKKLKQKGFTDVQLLPVLIDADSFKENIDFTDTLGLAHTDGVCYLSVDLDENNKAGFKEYLNNFKELKEKFGSHFRIIVIGDHPSKHFPNFDLEISHLPKGSIVHQFKNIVKSSADLHLQLVKKTAYYENHCSCLFSFVERGMFGIPLAGIDVYPIADLAKSNLAFSFKKRSDLNNLIEKLISDKKDLRDMSKKLKDVVLDQTQMNEEKLTKMSHVFFGGYE